MIEPERLHDMMTKKERAFIAVLVIVMTVVVLRALWPGIVAGSWL